MVTRGRDSAGRNYRSAGSRLRCGSDRLPRGLRGEQIGATGFAGHRRQRARKRISGDSAHRSTRRIDFGSGDEPCVPVSWGDIATAFHSTGVGNITAFLRRTPVLRLAESLGSVFGPLLRSGVGQRGLAALVRRLPEGPSQAERTGHRSTIWAEATDNSGRSSRARLSTPDAYDFAANSALEIATRISSLPAALGLVTPFQAFGADFVLSLPGCSRMDLPSI